jgi:hypothetical protein
VAGLNEGLEEVGFRPTAGGYVFQTNNRWFVGPKRSYLVTETQKAEIAACVRETLKSVKRFALIALAIFPLVVAAGGFWLASQRGTLTVTETHAGETAIYTQSIGLSGSTGTLRSGDSHLEFYVSGPPGDDAIVTVTKFRANGKPGVRSVRAFGSQGVNLNLTDSAGDVVASAQLSGSAGPAMWAIELEALAMAFVLLLPCMALVHIYSMRRLAPLLAGLPRTDAGVTVREGARQFAAETSVTLLAGMIGGLVLCLAVTLGDLTTALGEQDLTNAGMSALIAAGLGCMTVYYAYLAFLRFKGKGAA